MWHFIWTRPRRRKLSASEKPAQQPQSDAKAGAGAGETIDAIPVEDEPVGEARDEEKPSGDSPDKPDEPLALLGPRLMSLDATAAVASAVASGKGKVELLYKSGRGWVRGETRLDVSFTGGKASMTRSGGKVTIASVPCRTLPKSLKAALIISMLTKKT